jgi:hypothetical protein
VTRDSSPLLRQDRMHDLLRRLKAAGATFNPPATLEHLAQLETFVGAPLPYDVRTFYLSGNGIPDSETDAHMMCFWSIERILTDPDSLVVSNGQHQVAFADGMLNAWFFRYVPSSTGISVVSDLDPTHGSWPGLEQFLEAYLAAPEEISLV